MEMKSYKMLKTVTGSRDGLKVETFAKGETYPLNPELAEQFYHQAAVEEAEAEVAVPDTKPQAKDRSTKVTGPAETKVISPDESKDGEAGVDLNTQHIEELVALARDHYGLEVDTTMSEAEVRTLIEQAEGEAGWVEPDEDEASEEDPADATAKAKKAKKKGKK